jgi:hypothetical protein
VIVMEMVCEMMKILIFDNRVRCDNLKVMICEVNADVNVNAMREC